MTQKLQLVFMSQKKSTYDCRKFDAQDPVTTTISISHDDGDPWFDKHEDFDFGTIHQK